METLFEVNGAKFSECGKYRYALWRIWDKSKPLVMFIGLNPSTANASSDDPTIRRVRTISNNLGYGGFYMMNLFCFVTPYPKDLIKDDEIDRNNLTLEEIGRNCKDVIFAWGNFKEAYERSQCVQGMFPKALALEINKNGSPKHPLYVKGNIKPVGYNFNIPVV